METAKLRIRRMSDADEQAYTAFVAAHAEAMLYHSMSYLKLISALTEGENETLLAFDSSNSITGVLPIFSKTGSLGRVLNSLPYYGSNGGVLALHGSTERLLIEAYNRLAVADDVASATIVANPLIDPERYSEITSNLTDYRIGQFTKIAYVNDHGDQLMDSFHYKTRNMVRKGQRSGFTVCEENDQLRFLCEVHHENMIAIGGRAKNSDLFDLVPILFEAGKEYKIFVARFEGEPVAALLLFYFRDTVEYYMPVIRAGFRDRQPLSLLIFSAMEDASQRGFHLWNWGGTWATQDGVYTFKKRWGTEDVNYTYYTQMNKAEVYALKPEFLLQEYPGFFVIPFQHLNTCN